MGMKASRGRKVRISGAAMILDLAPVLDNSLVLEKMSIDGRRADSEAYSRFSFSYCLDV